MGEVANTIRSGTFPLTLTSPARGEGICLRRHALCFASRQALLKIWVSERIEAGARKVGS